MVRTEPLTQFPVRGADHTVPAVALDTDFETRWAAWVARGRAHEQRTWRTLIVWAGVLSAGAVIMAVIYALL